ncbi:MAG: ATP-dependent helicase RecQ [Bacteroidales bacterium]|jgi:ATP-dependent DNA helicase RecQ|nr:ATP-dependent helicase RecQ [Bacteroidales bacterium]MDN5328579.1 ATP-dependent helicase RecQ [Bacteroidales bacterium]
MLTRIEAEHHLAKVFGFSSFYDLQWEVIEKILHGRRVLLIEKTGFGKSLCYQFPATILEGVTIVFSPLIALMRDQVASLSSRGIPAAAIHSNQEKDKNDYIIEKAKKNELKLLYIAPERLENIEWIRAARDMRISLVVVDEAHCISMWGHTFRPNYRRIINLVNLLPRNFPVLATTATATSKVEMDIAEQIGGGIQVIRGRLMRPNIHLGVKMISTEDDKFIWLAQVLPKLPKPGIIYTGTQSDTDIYSNWLQYLNYRTAAYHGRLDADTRQKIEFDFMNNNLDCVVSTNALGMGIDKPDIRFIIHTQIPQSPIHYYQEIGRAGRDGEPSFAILLFNPKEDLALPRSFIENGKPSLKAYQKVMEVTRKQLLSRNEIIVATNLKQTQVTVILADLIDQNILNEQVNQRKKMYFYNPNAPEFDYSMADNLRKIQTEQLAHMEAYVYTDHCRMKYLCDYLGDRLDEQCGICDVDTGKSLPLNELHNIQERLQEFRETFFPVLEVETKGTKLINGVAASYYGITNVGQAIHHCKYEGGGDFPDWLLRLALKAYRKHFGNMIFDLILYVPPTESGDLVKNFAVKMAQVLDIKISHNLTKVYSTRPQKELQSAITKKENVKGKFIYRPVEELQGKRILLIDDIFDSGATVREIGRMLSSAGAEVIAPLVIARTVGGDL